MNKETPRRERRHLYHTSISKLCQTRTSQSKDSIFDLAIDLRKHAVMSESFHKFRKSECEQMINTPKTIRHAENTRLQSAKMGLCWEGANWDQTKTSNNYEAKPYVLNFLPSLFYIGVYLWSGRYVCKLHRSNFVCKGIHLYTWFYSVVNYLFTWFHSVVNNLYTWFLCVKNDLYTWFYCVVNDL